MKINKMKATSIAVCCLVASLWSETQCMDNQSDILESATINHTANILSSSQNEIDVLDLVSTSSQIINLEASEASWASYIISPVKANIQMAYDVVNYVVQHPQKGMIMALFLASQVTITAAQVYYECHCVFRSGEGNIILAHVVPCIDTMQDYYGCLHPCYEMCMGYNLTNAGHRLKCYSIMCMATNNSGNACG